MKVMVTGASGFLGKHLVHDLCGRPEVRSVLGVDTSPTHFRHPKYDHRHWDISDPYWVTVGVWRSFDRVYNLACDASPPKYKSNPVRTLRTCTDGIWHTLDCVAPGGRYLQASTSEVYGNPEVHPQPEAYRGNVSTTGPRACYDEGKRVAETILSVSPVDTRIARIFNTFGPGMSRGDGRMIPEFMLFRSKGLPIHVHGDGSQTRTLCYVDDLIRGLILLMESGCDVPVNLGGTEERTVAEWAALVDALPDFADVPSGGIKFIPQPCIHDPTRRKPDLWRARVELGWEPLPLTADRMSRTAQYFIHGSN